MSEKSKPSTYYKLLISSINKKIDECNQLKTKLRELELKVENIKLSITNAKESFNNGGFITKDSIFGGDVIIDCENKINDLSLESIINKINKEIVNLEDLARKYQNLLNKQE